MKKVIHKYRLPLQRDEFRMKMAPGKILACQLQDDQITVWVLRPLGFDEVQREFRILATGEVFDDLDGAWEYVGTVQIGWTVWHVYEVFPF